MLFHVTCYDKDGKVASVTPVEAESKSAAAEKVCGFEVANDVKPTRATASVVALGESAQAREYFQRASERQG